MSEMIWSALAAFSVGSFLSSCNFASPETYSTRFVLRAYESEYLELAKLYHEGTSIQN